VLQEGIQQWKGSCGLMKSLCCDTLPRGPPGGDRCPEPRVLAAADPPYDLHAAPSRSVLSQTNNLNFVIPLLFLQNSASLWHQIRPSTRIMVITRLKGKNIYILWTTATCIVNYPSPGNRKSLCVSENTNCTTVVPRLPTPSDSWICV
jgi:hypothetical protein